MDIQRDEVFEKWHFNKYYVEDADRSILYEKFESKDEYVSYEVQHSYVAWQAAKANAIPEGFILVPKELTHEQAVKISNDPEFFEIYQNIVTDSDTSEDSVSVLLRVAHKVMAKAKEPSIEK